MVEEQTGKGSNMIKEIISMVLYIVVVIAAAILLNKFVIQKVEVSGQSMQPTLYDEEQLILEKVSYYITTPGRNDIVVLNPPGFDEKTLYIKRVIGLPGETIQIQDGRVYIDGELFEEVDNFDLMYYEGVASEPIVLGEEEYFVLGDNRNDSEDSRALGAIPEDHIVGRAVLRLWPLSEFGLLH